MEYKILTKSYTFSFNNVYYDEKNNLIKTRLNKKDSKHRVLLE